MHTTFNKNNDVVHHGKYQKPRNCIHGIFFSRFKKKNFISVLALSDTLFLIIQLITLGLLESVNEYEFSKSVQFGRPVILPLRNFAYICSIYFIVLLTIERFIIICHQHKVQDISTLDFLTPSFNLGFPSPSSWLKSSWVKS